MLVRWVLAIMLLIGISEAKMMQMFQSVPEKNIEALQKGQDKMYCPNCGMYLPKFWKTSHAVKFKDGSYRQFCSIYCLVEQMEITELRGKHDTIKEILVVDVPSLKYIDAKKAYYVVGSKKAGTMTVTSKYAFKNQKDAKAFAAKNGGEITDFDGAYKIAIKDFARDTGLVLAKRSTKMYKMGKKFYENKCDKKKMSNMHAHTMGEMKSMIRDSNVCGKGLNDGQLQGIMLYYWDVKLQNFEKLHGQNPEIKKHAEVFKKKFQKMNQGK